MLAGSTPPHSLPAPIRYLLVGASFLFFVALSPKWTLPVCAWLAPACLLRLIRDRKPLHGFLLGYLITFGAGSIAFFEVFPFPLPVFLIIFAVMNLLALTPYLLDRLLAPRIKGLASTLVFPSAWVLVDYVNALGPSGVWSHLANTQVGFLPLMQWASITGIWGVTFLLYWFAAIANEVYERYRDGQPYGVPVGVYGFVLGMVLLFGFIRLADDGGARTLTVKVGAITTETLFVLEATYEAAFDSTITLSPELSQTSPELAEASKATLAFLESPDEPRFAPVYEAFDRSVDQFFALSEQAVSQGAQVVVWSEGAALNIKVNEDQYIQRASAFARQHGVYLFFPMAILHPERVSSGGPFIENKVLTIDPEGEVLNSYYKNVPVEGIEPSFPGDGNIPVFATSYGNLSPIICYDADFPALMAQTGSKDTQLLLVPSGDWKAISPYHSYMASVRAIENGTAMVRATAHGLHLATDPYGRILAQDDYFEDDDHVMVTEVPIMSVKTWYTLLGDVVPLFCLVILLGFVLRITQTWLFSRKRGHHVSARLRACSGFGFWTVRAIFRRLRARFIGP